MLIIDTLLSMESMLINLLKQMIPSSSISLNFSPSDVLFFRRKQVNEVCNRRAFVVFIDALFWSSSMRFRGRNRRAYVVFFDGLCGGNPCAFLDGRRNRCAFVEVGIVEVL